MKAALAVLALIIVLAAAAFLPVQPYQDFQVIYHADLGLLRGISLYDHAGQVAMIAQLASVPPDQVFVLPFPYPPWYALSTLWLARMPIDLAARAWLALNLAMLLASVTLLTAGESPLRRALSFLGAVLWLPGLGSLLVGQYGFPVLLGAALMIYALQKENALLVALAGALLTFKPHLGGLVLLLVALMLAIRHDRFSWNTVLALLLAGATLFAAGFLASPGWPAEYFSSLTGFKDVSQCGQCVSPAMALAGLVGGGFGLAVWIAAGIAIVLCIWLVIRWRRLSAAPDGLVGVGILLTLLVSPYLQNYDYLLLLAPFIQLARGRQSPTAWIALGLAYVLPFVCLALLGTAGNASLIVSASILFAVTAVGLRDRTSQPLVN